MHPKLLVLCLLWTAAAAAASTDVEARSGESLLRSATSSSPSLSSTDNVNQQHPLAPRVAPQSVLEDIEPPPACAAACVAETAPQFGCGVLEAQCQCSQPAFDMANGLCVQQNCSRRDGLVARHYSAVLCERPVHSRGRFVSEIKWSLFGLSTLALALRLLTRSPLLRGAGLGWDDGAISLAYVFLVAEEAGSEIMLQNGFGRDLWYLDPNEITTLLKWFWLGEIWYFNIMTWTKVSILAMCLRVWPRSTTTHLREAIYAVMAIIILSDVAFTFSIIFSCQPVEAKYTNWDLEHPGKCIKNKPHFIPMGVVNIILDLAVFFLPIPKLLQTQLPTRKKIGISTTFLVGLLVTIFSIVRLAMAVPALSTDNPSYDLVQVVAWSQFEFNFAIICACMPNYAGPIQRAWKWFRGLEPSKVYSSFAHSSLSSKHAVRETTAVPDDGGSESNLNHDFLGKSWSASDGDGSGQHGRLPFEQFELKDKEARSKNHVEPVLREL
ncbi:hypothetical protein KC332_g2584 [Hortaea werneckii]|nr:hypothetical protein KC358_g14887 [Hortaea werneckii]KAI6805479.1 hypothetical protein KC350_g14558 [Hortaea werneckii]KAI6923755.1 hypothetical protein KC341_g14510 [Hortaea werneckii]KAI6947220.1 hypothetical protein KC348_g2660 [Hortaea werneckii]KAI6957274.1 hypothetical protein KC321_g14683 [Hortaea werneckii]